VTAHTIAKELKEKHKIPWLADFRDLWTQNHNYPYSALRRIFERRLELKTLSTADALVTVSQQWAQRLGSLHRREVYAITNGFDPDQMSKGETDLTSKFTITYTGQIYTRQDPSKFLIALKHLLSKNIVNPEDIEVRFYGPEDGMLAKKIDEYQLSAVVKQYGTVSREDSFQKQRESQLLLLFKWEDLEERGWHSGKIFEYLSAKRPILATGGAQDVITEVLSQTSAGIDAKTVEDVEKTLEELYREFKAKGGLDYAGKEEEIDKYSYREMARKFQNILNTIT
jgi:glycosyltransferase involved in cell wall biosynthesis